MTVDKPIEQVVREDIQRQVLEAAACRVEALSGNTTYQQAWRIAARCIRSLKPG